jgi:hypothetical protein
MICPACTQYASNPSSGAYRAGCTECATRSLALSPAFFESQRQGAITKQYRAALERAFAGDWRRGHEVVKAWKINPIEGIAK